MAKAADPKLLAIKHGVDCSGDCWLWTKSLDTHGYGRVSENGRQRLAHRAFYQAAFGTDPTGGVVMHKCDNPRCVNPAHLLLGTQRDNIADRHSKGRNGALRGDAAPWSSLTAEQVEDLRNRFQAGEPRETLRAHFGISKTQMYRVVNRESWRHL